MQRGHLAYADRDQPHSRFHALAEVSILESGELHRSRGRRRRRPVALPGALPRDVFDDQGRDGTARDRNRYGAACWDREEPLAPCAGCGAQGDGEDQMNTNHLSPWEQEEYVLDQRTPEMLRHLSECAGCRAAVARLEHGVAVFRSAAVDWSSECLATRPQQLNTSAARGFPVHGLRWAVAAVLPV